MTQGLINRAMGALLEHCANHTHHIDRQGQLHCPHIHTHTPCLLCNFWEAVSVTAGSRSSQSGDRDRSPQSHMTCCAVILPPPHRLLSSSFVRSPSLNPIPILLLSPFSFFRELACCMSCWLYNSELLLQLTAQSLLCVCVTEEEKKRGRESRREGERKGNRGQVVKGDFSSYCTVVRWNSRGTVLAQRVALLHMTGC